MKEWKKYKALELCTDIIDCVNKTAPISSTPTDFHMLRTSDIRNGFVNLENLNCVTEETFLKWSRRGFLKEGDVIFTREAPLGEVGLVRYAKNYFLGQRLVLYRTNPEICDNRFLLYWFLNPQNKESIKSKGVGSTVTHLRVPECGKIEIYAPDLAMQKRIGGILSAYDDLIENNQKQIKLLEETAQRLYKEWFVDLRFPDYENTPVVDGVPEGWRKSKFFEVFDFVRGKSYTSKELSKDTGAIMVNLKNIRAFGGYKRNAEKRFTGVYNKSQLLVGGDIVMGVTDMTKERRLVGHVALIPKFNEKVIFSMDLIKLIPLTVSKNFLYCAFQYGGYSEKISPLANGVNVLHLKPEAMMNMEMVVPDEKSLQAFDNQFEVIRLKIEALEKQCNLAIQARDRLLPKLMSGELEV